MDKKELLKKIKNLAARGIGGEQQNAEKLLQQLMEKYNITDDELNDDAVHEYRIKLKRGEHQLMLARQVFYSIVGDEIYNSKPMFSYRRATYIQCTSSELLEFEARYNHYAQHFIHDLSVFYTAFLQTNNIFPIGAPTKTEFANEEELQRAIDIQNMSLGMKKHEYHKQIGETSK